LVSLDRDPREIILKVDHAIDAQVVKAGNGLAGNGLQICEEKNNWLLRG
jgi:hypothetical protein